MGDLGIMKSVCEETRRSDQGSVWLRAKRVLRECLESTFRKCLENALRSQRKPWVSAVDLSKLIEWHLHYNETTTTLFVKRWDVLKFSCHWKLRSWPNPAKDNQKGLLKPLHCSESEWTLLAPIKIIFHWLTFTLCKKLIIWARFYKRIDTVDFKSENPAQFIDWIQHEIIFQWV